MKPVELWNPEAWRDHHRGATSARRTLEAWILGVLAVLGWLSALVITLATR